MFESSECFSSEKNVKIEEFGQKTSKYCDFRPVYSNFHIFFGSESIQFTLTTNRMEYNGGLSCLTPL